MGSQYRAEVDNLIKIYDVDGQCRRTEIVNLLETYAKNPAGLLGEEFEAIPLYLLLTLLDTTLLFDAAVGGTYNFCNGYRK